MHPATSAKAYRRVRSGVVLASARAISASNPTRATGSPMRFTGVKNKGGRVASAVVVTVTVTVSAVLAGDGVSTNRAAGALFGAARLAPRGLVLRAREKK